MVAENIAIGAIRGGGDTGHPISMAHIKCWSDMGYTVMEITLWPSVTGTESGRGL